MAGTQPDERGDSRDLDVFDEGGKDEDLSVKSEGPTHEIKEADADGGHSSGDPDLKLGGSPSKAEDPADIFTDTGNSLELDDDEVESAEPPPALNLDDKQGDEKVEDKGEGGSEDPKSGEDPPLQSAELPDLTFTPPPAEPQIESNELPEATYGSTDDVPVLVSVDLPELVFDFPQEQVQGGASEVVEVVYEEENDDAVVFEDDDSAVVLDDDTPEDDEIEVEPLPDYPDDDDDDGE